MNNKNTEEFFEKLLGFGPDWGVASIELSDDGSAVELGLKHRREGSVECPECGKISALHDHARERRWRHLDMLQYETRIRARIPRCECPECGVHQIKVPWAEPNARFTLLFEAHAIEVHQAARSTTQACDLPGIEWSTADTIMKRAVTWWEYRITNAINERLNSKIQIVKSAARAFHSFESYRVSILFFCGKLDMSPITSHSD